MGLTLIACGSNDDDDVGRTTDPIIGTWTVDDRGDSATIVFNEDGTFTQAWSYSYDPQNPDIFSGTWRNNGSDFSSTTQIYTTTEQNSEGIDDGEEDTFVIIFSDDFNSFYIQDDTVVVHTRQ